jgi:biotin synthase-like enzyme
MSKQRKWTTSATAFCLECGWRSDKYYSEVVDDARKHHQETGHTVCGEVGLAFQYDGVPNREEEDK